MPALAYVGLPSPPPASAVIREPINLNVIMPPGTALVGTARQVGEVLAPHIAREFGSHARHLGRAQA